VWTDRRKLANANVGTTVAVVSCISEDMSTRILAFQRDAAAVLQGFIGSSFVVEQTSVELCRKRFQRKVMVMQHVDGVRSM
jgi:hypothetical protein